MIADLNYEDDTFRITFNEPISLDAGEAIVISFQKTEQGLAYIVVLEKNGPENSNVILM